MKGFPMTHKIRIRKFGISKFRNRKFGFIAMAALAPFFLCGATSPTGCQPQQQPSNAGIYATAAAVGGGIVVGAIILVEVNKSHHTVRGCVSAGPNGLVVHNESDNANYALVGVTANTKVGDRVRLHGSKDKKSKDSPADRTFVVEKVTKDYGPCTVGTKP
jgi:hypothetical protein